MGVQPESVMPPCPNYSTHKDVEVAFVDEETGYTHYHCATRFGNGVVCHAEWDAPTPGRGLSPEAEAMIARSKARQRDETARQNLGDPSPAPGRGLSPDNPSNLWMHTNLPDLGPARVWSCCGAPHPGPHLDICPHAPGRGLSVDTACTHDGTVHTWREGCPGFTGRGLSAVLSHVDPGYGWLPRVRWVHENGGPALYVGPWMLALYRKSTPARGSSP